VIGVDVIRRLAVSQQTTELNIAREYSQHLFLSAFYQQPGAQRVMFKGGTALKMAYQSPRFSEDLDFSGFRISARDIENRVVDAAEAVEKTGVAVAAEESTKTSGGYVARLKCSFAEYRVRVQMEVSLRRSDGVTGRGMLIASDLVPPYTATLLPEDLLVEEKLTALLTRKTPRDFFDCYFLLRKGLIRAEQQHLLAKVRSTLLASRANFKTELEDFLPRSYHPLLKDFKQTLLAELERYGF